MNTVTLMPDGGLAAERDAAVDEPLGCLGHRVLLESACTLRSLYRMVDRHPVLARLNVFFPAQLEQFRSCPGRHCTGSGFDGLEFSKTIEMIGFPGRPRLDIYHSLRGRMGSEIHEIKTSRLDGLLDLPLKLGKLKHVIYGDNVDIFEFDTVYTLFELLDGVAWELSFHGTPGTCAL